MRCGVCDRDKKCRKEEIYDKRFSSTRICMVVVDFEYGVIIDFSYAIESEGRERERLVSALLGRKLSASMTYILS